MSPYMLTEPQREKIVRAKEESIRRCMARFGFKYTPSKPAAEFSPETITALRYGLTSASDAKAYGYRPKGGDGNSNLDGGKGVKPDPSGPDDATNEYSTILRGEQQNKGRKNIGIDQDRHKEQPVPDGGCIGEARQALRDTEKDGGGGDAEVSNQVNAASWQNSYEDSRVRAVFKKWAACMKVAGYDYIDPMAANNDPKWAQNPRVTLQEKKVAATDAGCKRKHNVVGTWYAVDASYQRAMMADREKSLSAVKQHIATQLRLAADILAKGEK